MKKKLCQAIGLIGMLGAASLSSALNFNQIYSFGDSLSDVGNNPQAPITNDKGDIWNKDLARRYGIDLKASDNGGTDFAYAGEETTDLAVQLAQLQTSGKQLDSQGLYTVWAGANDIFNHVFSPDAIQPVADASTNNVVNMVNQLHTSGARYIIVANMPDLSVVPLAHHPLVPPGYGTLIGYASSNLNDQLLTKINNLPYDVIQVDIYTLLDQVYANSQAYRFTNVLIPCNISGDCEHSMFYDYIHPTVKGHQIIADYVYSVLKAPEFAAMLPELSLGSFASQNHIIQQNLPGRSRQLPVGKAAFFVGGNYSKIIDGTVIKDLLSNYAGNTTSFTTGLLYAVNEALTTGASFSYSANQMNFAKLDNSSIDWRSSLVALFADYQFTKAYVNAILSLGTVNFKDMHRRFYLGPHLEDARGAANGSLFGAHLGTGYRLITVNNFTSGPFLTLDYTRVDIDSYTEKGAMAADIAFEKQKRNFFTSSLGWDAIIKYRIGRVDAQTHVFVAGNRQWLTGDKDIGFHVATLPGSHASLPVGSYATNYVSTGINVNMPITQQLGLGVGYEFDKGNHDLQQHHVMLNLQYQFN